MGYSVDLKKAARRHLEAAHVLHDPPNGKRHGAVAGYLYGVAAECALKAIMRDSAMQPLPPSQRREDPYYAHFPVLKTMLRDAATGRRHVELLKHAKSDALMANWDVEMRYAPLKDVDPTWVARWREQAHELVSKMEGP